MKNKNNLIEQLGAEKCEPETTFSLSIVSLQTDSRK